METIVIIIIVTLFFLISFAMVLLPLVSIIFALLGKFSNTEKDKSDYFKRAKKSLLTLLLIVLVGCGVCFGLVALSPIFQDPMETGPLQTEPAN